ncbi:MAG: flagellar assembly protein FliW [Gemmatimonadaceae bacterium]
MSTALAPNTGLVNVTSQVLGTLQVSPQDLITFPVGIFGFPEARTFALLPTPREGIYWLQSADHPALAFLLADPFLYFPNKYQIDLAAAELTRLGSPSAQDTLVLAVVTMPAHSADAYTANLQAPLLFNLQARRAFQSVRPDDGFSVREAFDVDMLLSGSGR